MHHQTSHIRASKECCWFDQIRSDGFSEFRSDKERSDAVLDLLRVYFTLKDCVDDGEKLVAEAEPDPDPVEKISSMEPDDAIATLERWDATIRKQGIRLYQLQGAIFGQDHLTVINPELQECVSEVIGYKMDRTVTLHGIGSALFFRAAFPIENTTEEKDCCYDHVITSMIKFRCSRSVFLIVRVEHST